MDPRRSFGAELAHLSAPALTPSGPSMFRSTGTLRMTPPAPPLPLSGASTLSRTWRCKSLGAAPRNGSEPRDGWGAGDSGEARPATPPFPTRAFVMPTTQVRLSRLQRDEEALPLDDEWLPRPVSCATESQFVPRAPWSRSGAELDLTSTTAAGSVGLRALARRAPGHPLDPHERERFLEGLCTQEEQRQPLRRPRGCAGASPCVRAGDAPPPTGFATPGRGASRDARRAAVRGCRQAFANVAATVERAAKREERHVCNVVLLAWARAISQGCRLDLSSRAREAHEAQGAALNAVATLEAELASARRRLEEEVRRRTAAEQSERVAAAEAAAARRAVEEARARAEEDVRAAEASVATRARAVRARVCASSEAAVRVDDFRVRALAFAAWGVEASSGRRLERLAEERTAALAAKLANAEAVAEKAWFAGRCAEKAQAEGAELPPSVWDSEAPGGPLSHADALAVATALARQRALRGGAVWAASSERAALLTAFGAWRVATWCRQAVGTLQARLFAEEAYRDAALERQRRELDARETERLVEMEARHREAMAEIMAA